MIGDKRKRRRDRIDRYRQLFSTPDGMWVMRDLARVSRAMKSVYIEDGTGRVDTHKMAWLEGNRNLFLLIYKLAYQDDPDADLDGFDPEDFYQDFESRRENE